MFLNYLKDISTKKIVKNSLSNVKPALSGDEIKTVGILFDEDYYHEKDALISSLVNNGINEDNIKVLVYKKKIRSSDAIDYPVFSQRDFSWTAKIEKPSVKDFIANNFDLLINYYDIEKAPLLLVSHLSKATFKVGFSSIDKRINHFMITTQADNHQVFTDELCKYLKILNKIQ